MSLDDIHAAEVAAGQELAFIRQRVTGWTVVERLLLVGVILGTMLAVGAWAFGPRHAVPEVVQARPEVVQPGGAHVAATLPPDSAAARALPTPDADIPKGAVVQRRGRTILQPRATAASACPPVTVDLQQYQQGDTVRVVASSPDATVLSSVDVPLRPQLLPAPSHKWALGLSYGTDRAAGVWVERDLGRLRAGVEVERGLATTTARVRLGVTW